MAPLKRKSTQQTMAMKKPRFASRRKMIMRQPNAEMKFLTTTISHNATTQSNTVTTLIPNGSSSAERIGRKVKFWNLELCMSQTSTTSEIYRVVVYRPKADVADRLTLSNASSPVDIRKFHVLHDQWVGVGNDLRGLKKYLKFPYGIIGDYETTSGSSYASGPVVVSITSPGSDTIEGYTRMYFTDT